jgi:hypothetical protein
MTKVIAFDVLGAFTADLAQSPEKMARAFDLDWGGI